MASTDQKNRLAKLEHRITADPDTVQWRFEYACLLSALGRTEDAKKNYLEILARWPTHGGTLNNLGAILYETGYRSAAKTVYSQAVASHPDDPMGHVNLANLLLQEGDAPTARVRYETALKLNPDLPAAHQGMARIFMIEREEESARFHREKGFRPQAVTTLPYLGVEPPVPLTLFVSAEGGDIPLSHLIDNRIFQTTAIFAEFYDPQKRLPPHQLIFNTIGDADLCRPALEAAERLLANVTTPVLNPPAAVLKTGRLENAQQMAKLPGVRAPKISLLPRDMLTGKNALSTLTQEGFKFPLLLRAPGFHTGQHFIKVENSNQLNAAAASLPGKDSLIIEYLPARGTDGRARKYRVMMIDGRLYPLHLAISEEWKVHYFTAAMSGHTEHQAEEKRFLDDMNSVLGARGIAALGLIQDQLQLDYGGIDFGLDEQGNILLFEANATMVIHPPAQEQQWAYRQEAISRAQQAVRDMLKKYANKKG